MSAILTLALKDVRLLFRDKFGLFWVLAFPLLYSVFFGLIFSSGDSSGRGSISVAIVDEDQTEDSAKLIEHLAKNDALRMTRQGEDGDGPPVLYSLEEARNAVRKGNRVAYLRIPKGYGGEPFAMFAGDEAVKLEVGLDPSRKAESGLLQGVLMGTTFEVMSTSFTDRDLMAEQIDIGRSEIMKTDDLDASQKLILTTFFSAMDEFIGEVDFDIFEADGEEGEGGGGFAGFGGEDLVDTVDVSREIGKQPRTSFEVTFPQAIVWGLMSVAMGFAITFVRERSGGTLLRLSIAPINQAQLMAGKALGCFLTAQIVMAVLVVVGTLAMNVRVENPLLMLMATTATAIGFTGLMMTASVLGKTEQAVAGAAWGVMMPFAMIGGGMIPLIAMPDWLVVASDFSPFKWAIVALEGAVWRGFTFTEMLKPCAILVATGGAFFAFGVWVYRRGEA